MKTNMNDYKHEWTRINMNIQTNIKYQLFSFLNYYDSFPQQTLTCFAVFSNEPELSITISAFLFFSSIDYFDSINFHNTHININKTNKH